MCASHLEIIMVLCFGSAWPFAIFRTLQQRSGEGKSRVFLCINLLGYATGMYVNFLQEEYLVIAFYSTNFSMVLIDLLIVFYFNHINRKQAVSNAHQKIKSLSFG